MSEELGIIEEKIEKEVEKAEKAKEEIIIEERRDSSGWNPKTKVGRMVKNGEIKNIDEVLEKYKILEAGIVDSLVNIKSDFLAIGQSKGKFGGGKRRVWKQTQKKTMEGNDPSFSCLAVVGDESGHVGMGLGKARETLPAREKSVRDAKINLIKVERGCGSFDCACGEKHSIPRTTEGKSGSCKVILIPAPQGTGLVAADELKKMLKLVGIKDIYSKTFGSQRTTINLARACLDALRKLEEK